MAVGAIAPDDFNVSGAVSASEQNRKEVNNQTALPYKEGWNDHYEALARDFVCK